MAYSLAAASKLCHRFDPEGDGNMNVQAELRCRCGEVRAVVSAPSPKTVNRVICYCDDCQAFAHQLGRSDLLDANGGTDIVQVAPASLTFVQGRDKIAALRLTPKGLYRWYARCCNTPVGNTLSPSLPFVGVVAQAFEGDGQSPDALFGRPVSAILGKFAIGDVPPKARGMSFSLLLRVLRLMLGWRLTGKTWPHPFFERGSSAPLYPIIVLSREQREALRPLCGPQPQAPTSVQ
jgi:hypothetical protein